MTDITEKLHISRSMLHYKMKTFTDMSIGDYIRHKRIEKAFKKLMGVAPSFYTPDNSSTPVPPPQA